MPWGFAEAVGRREVPELPEVETLRRQLEEEILGEEILGVSVFDSRLKGAEALLKGRVYAVRRHGKVLILVLQRGEVAIRLGMSGRLRLGPPDGPPRLTIRFPAGEIHLIDRRRLSSIGPLEGLPKGIDPFLEDPPVWSSRRPVKALLMDQDFLLGVGNIYASEALFVAGVNPFVPAFRLSPGERQRVLGAVRGVLLEAVSLRGTTISDWRDLYGRPGLYQERLRVYGREGRPCPRCGSPIRRRVLSGRGTWFCPSCQIL